MPEEYITAKAASEMLETTTKIIRELVERGLLHPVQLSPHKKMYLKSEIEELASKKEEIDLLKKKESVVSLRNTLNDLNGTEWLPETKSFFFQRGLGSSSNAAQIEKQHPAPFSFQDIEKLISFTSEANQYHFKMGIFVKFGFIQKEQKPFFNLVVYSNGQPEEQG